MRLLKSHGWDKPASNEDDAKPGEPLPTTCLQQICSATGPAEGTSAHSKLQKQKGFSCRTLLGEILCACVTCRPDCGHAVVTLSKFASAPAAIHHDRLRALAKHLRRTAHWGITFWRPAPLMTLSEDPTPVPTPEDKDLPEFPSPESPQELVGHVDAAHANDLRNRRSTTGHVFTMAGVPLHVAQLHKESQPPPQQKQSSAQLALLLRWPDVSEPFSKNSDFHLMDQPSFVRTMPQPSRLSMPDSQLKDPGTLTSSSLLFKIGRMLETLSWNMSPASSTHLMI